MRTLPSGLPEIIGGDEDLVRFLTSSSQFNSKGVKPSAFLPNLRDRETSVSRHGENPEYELWNLGIMAAGGRNLHGAAILKAASAFEANLTTTSDEPPDRHAVIGGWPWNDNDQQLQKAQQLERANVLASRSRVVLREQS
jgi:hypothetical protein